MNKRAKQLHKQRKQSTSTILEYPHGMKMNVISNVKTEWVNGKLDIMQLETYLISWVLQGAIAFEQHTNYQGSGAGKVLSTTTYTPLFEMDFPLEAKPEGRTILHIPEELIKIIRGEY